jgi:hypothetical protein
VDTGVCQERPAAGPAGWPVGDLTEPVQDLFL